MNRLHDVVSCLRSSGRSFLHLHCHAGCIMGTLKAERVGRSLEGRVTAWTFAVHLPVMLKAWNGEVPTELETLELMYW